MGVTAFCVRMLGVAAAALLSGAGAAEARDQVKIVGSSTVFPFATKAAEQFGKNPEFPQPSVESTGSGGGLTLFCAGVGKAYPDIANASRRIKASEFALCQKNGVTGIIEALAGYDGIVVANAAGGPVFTLTRAQLWTALAAAGPKPVSWNEVDASLPGVKIEVLGPPPSSGTRDAFEELAMQAGCREAGGAASDCKGAGAAIRRDGAYIEAGENDNVIVAKLGANPNAVGVFGYSFLAQNADKLQAAQIGGVAPSFDSIASGAYPLSRSLYLYVKKAHVGVIPGVIEYLGEFLSPAASGPDGYMARAGLIPLSKDVADRNRGQALKQTAMTGAETLK